MAEDRPIGGGGGYQINWDEIDENTNPFGLGSAAGGSKLPSSPQAQPSQPSVQETESSAPKPQAQPTPPKITLKKPVPPATPIRSPSTSVSSVLPQPSKIASAPSVTEKTKSLRKDSVNENDRIPIATVDNDVVILSSATETDVVVYSNRAPTPLLPKQSFALCEFDSNERTHGDGVFHNLAVPNISKEKVEQFSSYNHSDERQLALDGQNCLSSLKSASPETLKQRIKAELTSLDLNASESSIGGNFVESAAVCEDSEPGETKRTYGYNVDWSAIDASTNPFELGLAFGKDLLKISPKLLSGDKEIPQTETQPDVDAFAVKARAGKTYALVAPKPTRKEITKSYKRGNLSSGGSGYNVNWDSIDAATNPWDVCNGNQIKRSHDEASAKSATEPSVTEAEPVSTDGNPCTGRKSNYSIVANETKEVSNAPQKSPTPPPRPYEPKVIDIAAKSSFESESLLRVAEFEDPSMDIANVPPPSDFTGEPVKHSLPTNNEDTLLNGQPPELEALDRRHSNSSAATFDLVSGNRSPVPEVDLQVSGDVIALSVNEELDSLRADKEHLTTLVADMQRCIAEYERSLRQLADEKSRAEDTAKESVIGIISERDQAIEEISTIEKAFGDLHRRFEKSKQIIEGFKQNEDALKKTAESYQNQLKRQEQKYQALKAHAELKLVKVAEEIEKAKRSNEDEVTGLRAAIKRSELRIRSLESQLEQKVRENTELTKICDELLSKYGDKL